MPTHTWQKSSYCGQGESCVHISADLGTGPAAIRLIESGDASRSVLTATPAAFAALLGAVSQDRIT
ncbi:DUF397 domain-containing protein [Streptomyces sp. NPDC001858]